MADRCPTKWVLFLALCLLAVGCSTPAQEESGKIGKEKQRNFLSRIYFTLDREKLSNSGIATAEVGSLVDSFFREHGAFSLRELEELPIGSKNGRSFFLKDFAAFEVTFRAYEGNEEGLSVEDIRKKRHQKK